MKPLKRIFVRLATLSVIILILAPTALAITPTGIVEQNMQPTIGRLWESPDLGGYVWSIAWSPDGTKIAVGADSKVVVFSSSGIILWEKKLNDIVRSVAWSPDGTKIAVGGDFHKIIMLSPIGKLLWESPDLGNTVWSIAWSPNGDKLVVGGDFHKIIVFSSTGQKLWERNLDDIVRSVAWSPDGDKIAIGGDFRKIIVFSTMYNNAPFASFSIGGQLIVGAEVLFDASSSYDPDGEIVKYIWDFGDGTVVETTDPKATHVYDEPGTYTVDLTVLDNNGLKTGTSMVIEVIDTTADIVEVINDILNDLRSSVDAEVKLYGEYWGMTAGTILGHLIVNWVADEVEANYRKGVPDDELKEIDKILAHINFVENLEKLLSEAGVSPSKLSVIMENYRRALTFYKYIKDIHEVSKVLEGGDIATWLSSQLADLIKQGAKDAIFYSLVKLGQKYFSFMAVNRFTDQLRNEGYYEVFNPLTENEIEELRSYLASLSEEDYYNLLALLSLLKEKAKLKLTHGTYLSYLPLYDDAEKRWVGSIAWHIQYIGDAIDYWANGEKSKLIVKFGNYISGTIGYKVLPPFLLVSTAINMYIDQAFSVYESYEFAALINLGEVTKDFNARLRIYQQMADFVRHIAKHGDEINKILDIMSESYRLPSKVTVPIGSIGYECTSNANWILGVVHSTRNHQFPYAQAFLSSVGFNIAEPNYGTVQHQFYGSPFTCLALKDAGSQAICSLLAQKIILINAIKPNIEIKYTLGTSLGTVNVNLVNHEKSKMFVCASINTPLISLKPDDFKCTILSPNSETQIFTNVNVGKALIVTAGRGYTIHLTLSITLDIIGNWIGSIVTLTENQHKLFAKVTDNEGRIVGIEDGNLKIEIPGAYYVDFMNGTIKIFLPPSLTEYNVIVDASNATDKLETYTLHITKVDNGELISAITINATITQKEKQIGTVRIHENQLELTNINMNITESSTKGQASIISATTTPTIITTTNTTIQITTTSPSNTVTQTTRITSRTVGMSKTATLASTTTPTSSQQTSILRDTSLYIAIIVGIISMGVILAFIKKK